MTAAAMRKVCNLAAQQPFARNFSLINYPRCNKLSLAPQCTLLCRQASSQVSTSGAARKGTTPIRVSSPASVSRSLRTAPLQASAVSAPPAKNVAPPPAAVDAAIPATPKPRKLTGWIVFCNDNRAKAKVAHPDKAMKDILKVLSQEWAALSATAKAQYNQKAASLPPVPVKPKKSPSATKEKRRINRKPQPPNGYMVYASQNRARVKAAYPKANAKEVVKILGAEWQKLSAAQKEDYKAQGVRQFQAALAQKN